jgi:hypothetical protein
MQGNVVGMLGMEALALFDADLDFPAARVRLWPPGGFAAAGPPRGLTPVPAAVLNESGLLGIRATAAIQSPVKAPFQQQPFVGIVDCGASFSAINTAAAQLLGLYGGAGRLKDPGPQVLSLGVDGTPAPYPTTRVTFTFAGNTAITACACMRCRSHAHQGEARATAAAPAACGAPHIARNTPQVTL